MEYHAFFNTVKSLCTQKISASYQPESCALADIPKAVLFVMPSIITLLDTHHASLCQPDKNMVIVGMQACTMAIHSKMPAQLQRIFYPQEPEQHLCLSLLYQQQHRLFEQTDSVVIDLTLGHIMDTDAYCERLFRGLDRTKPDSILDSLDEAMMINLWKNLPQNSEPHPPTITTKEKNDANHPQKTVNR